MRVMRQLLANKPDRVTQFADALVEARAGGTAVVLVEEHALVEDAIRGRDRRTYQQAAQYRKWMKRAYKALQAQSE